MRRATAALALVALLPLALACVLAADERVGPPVRLPVGDARLDFDEEAGLDAKLGEGFRIAVRDATVLYTLTYWPEVAPSWELRGQPGTMRGTTRMR